MSATSAHHKSPHRLGIIVACALLAATAASTTAAGAPSGMQPGSLQPNNVSPATVTDVTIAYRSHTGAIRHAEVLLPSWYTPQNNPALPLVISPHGRGGMRRSNATYCGRLRHC